MADKYLDIYNAVMEAREEIFFEEIDGTHQKSKCEKKFEEDRHAWGCEKRYLQACVSHQAASVS